MMTLSMTRDQRVTHGAEEGKRPPVVIVVPLTTQNHPGARALRVAGATHVDAAALAHG